MKALETERGRHDAEPEQPSPEAFETSTGSGSDPAMEAERSGSGAGSRRPQVSLVLVAHRSSRVLPRALAAWRREVAAASLAAEVVVVEQSDDPQEAERVALCTPDRLLERPNRGYAAGINAGIVAARGDVLLVGNPDVELTPGALAHLLAALESGWDVVGPQFELAGFLFPPAEPQSPAAELRRWLAAANSRRWERLWRSELARWEEVWQAREPVEVPSLSGALMAFRRSVWERLGPWDESFFLYFEETEWLRRGRRQGVRLAAIPQARAAHPWGHAAEPSRQVQRWAASRRRYFSKCFPVIGPVVLRLPARSAPHAPAPWPPADELEGDPGLRWLLSPAPLGLPAARLEAGRDLVTSLEAFALALPSQRDLLVLACREDGSLAGLWRWAGLPRP
jgi:GT2 family glycosyltransferase